MFIKAAWVRQPIHTRCGALGPSPDWTRRLQTVTRAQVLGDLVAAAADGLQPTLARGLLVAVASALTRVLLDGGPQRCGARA